MTALRDDWEETSFQLEKLQTRHSCVQQEQQTLATRKQPKWLLSFDPNSLPLRSLGEYKVEDKVKDRVIRLTAEFTIHSVRLIVFCTLFSFLLASSFSTLACQVL